MGSYGPSSFDPTTNKKLGTNFPVITINDMVNAQYNLLDLFKIDKLFSVTGGSMGGIFTVGITLLGERFRDVELVSANAVFAVLFGVGGLLGPFMTGTAMSTMGPDGFRLSILAPVVIYGLFALYRQLTRSRRLA